jgi:hypothetical protein
LTLTSKQAEKRGRKGGRAKSPEKAAAVRENGKLGGRPGIVDEFTDLPVSKQRKHQLRKARDNRWPKKENQDEKV